MLTAAIGEAAGAGVGVGVASRRTAGAASNGDSWEAPGSFDGASHCGRYTGRRRREPGSSVSSRPSSSTLPASTADVSVVATGDGFAVGGGITGSGGGGGVARSMDGAVGGGTGSRTRRGSGCVGRAGGTSGVVVRSVGAAGAMGLITAGAARLCGAGVDDSLVVGAGDIGAGAARGATTGGAGRGPGLPPEGGALPRAGGGADDVCPRRRSMTP